MSLVRYRLGVRVSLVRQARSSGESGQARYIQGESGGVGGEFYLRGVGEWAYDYCISARKGGWGCS